MATPRRLQGGAPASAYAGPLTMTVGIAAKEMLRAVHGAVRTVLVSSHCGFPDCSLPQMHTCPVCCSISLPVWDEDAEAIGEE